MKRKSFNVVDYDYTKHLPVIDYSEKVTEPGLVLSMREIYQRYAAQGIDLLNGDLVDDQESPDDTEFFDGDDRLDALQAAAHIRHVQESAEHSARRAAKGSKKEPDKTKTKSDDDDTKRSEVKEEHDEV